VLTSLYVLKCKCWRYAFVLRWVLFHFFCVLCLSNFKCILLLISVLYLCILIFNHYIIQLIFTIYIIHIFPKISKLKLMRMIGIIFVLSFILICEIISLILWHNWLNYSWILFDFRSRWSSIPAHIIKSRLWWLLVNKLFI
jgi:hypothetical protein